MFSFKNLILKPYLFLNRLSKYYRWRKESYNIMSTVTCCKRHFNELPEGKYVILIPHSDDEWIGCSTLISNPRYEVLLCNTNMSGGDSDKVHNIRYEEMLTVVDRFGRKLISLGSNKLNDLQTLISEEKPSYVMVPCIYDWHDEHFQVMQLLADLDSSYKSFKVFMYEVTVPIPREIITHRNTLNKHEWREKWEIFRSVYITQKYFPWKRVAYNEIVNGCYTGDYACEVFVCLTYEKWKDYFKSSIPTEEWKKRIKNSVNSITDINHTILQYYDSIKNEQQNR